ncbi:MAG TPA: DUF1127 domain-containing protein [Alphaproteobacteria bacterium]|nr:DUF1127 domain-containing protein [Alphaproteobacteria bacterium]
MATDTTASSQARPLSSGWLPTLKCRLARLASRLWLCRQVQRERAQLRALSNRELRDIGLSRCDALAEARRPFWR